MRIVNASQNNLKNVSLELPEQQLIVVTGLSGSGKSSLAMGIIGNEGYRYFLESLPAYNQQNSQRIPTAEVDEIQDLPPVIKVEQSKRFQSLNATFGTLSELTQLFRILFARYSAEESMSKSLFSFNHPKGACETCRGIGEAEYIDVEKLIGDPNKSLREGAITTTLPTGYIVYSQVTVEELNKVCEAHGFSVDIPWKELSEEQQNVILNGSNRIKVYYGKHSIESRLRWEGLKAKPREEGFYKGVLPIMSDILKRDRNPNILRFTSSKKCPSCNGARIKKEHLSFQWQNKNFHQWMELNLSDLYDSLTRLKLKRGEELLVNKIITQLFDLIRLGMDHYSLSSLSTDISSGDGQRIKLVKQVNSNLQGILYVFDEPSIGLPMAYQVHLRHILDRLIARGNTVLVVEHDLNFIKTSDWIVELGPNAGKEGGEVLFNGSTEDFLIAKNLNSATRKALVEEEQSGEIKSVSEDDFNLKLGNLSVICKKTKLVQNAIHSFCEEHEIDLQKVNDQPIGKTPRSNPSTYTGLADKIRDLLAKTAKAKELKLAKGAFSFNNKIGRCANCEGAGVISLSMSVMGTINQTCPVCNGKRFNKQVLEVKWQEKNISEIYNLSVREAYSFFQEESKLISILKLMIDLGLGYLKLGQPSNTLSGGEAQRIKLTKHFAKSSKRTLLVLEEPSIGLHYQNVKELLAALQVLKKQTAGILCFENHALFQTKADVCVDNALKSDGKELPLELWADQNKIEVKGARTHALKDVNITFAKNKLSVVTGVSGSGKSSLVIDTIHGYALQEMTKQFSSYAQSRVGGQIQFEVDTIEGLTPTICITRKEKNYSSKTDIAQVTDIDKSLRFAFSRKAQFIGDELSASHFSKNHELGRCAVCEGLGEALIPDETKIVLDARKSIDDGLFEHNKALTYYGQAAGQYMAILGELGKEFGFKLTTPFKEYSSSQKQIIFYGIKDREWEVDWIFKTKTREGVQKVKMEWKGLFNLLLEEYFKTRKNKNIKQLTDLFSYETCNNCKGSGLKSEHLKYTIDGKAMHQVKNMNFHEFQTWLLKDEVDKSIDKELKTSLYEHLKTTLQRADQLHISHLQLNRKSRTLSGGEHQRIALIKQLNSPLKGITYLLDEPSAGLSVDNIPDLIDLLKELVRKGNTVIVIEHNKEIVLAAEEVIEIGPRAGSEGGSVTFHGAPKELLQLNSCHPFLKQAKQELKLEKGSKHISFEGIDKYSLQKSHFELSVGGITALIGKSGIGKTTLVKEVLVPSLETNSPVNCAKFNTPEEYKGVRYFEPKKLQVQNATLLVAYLDVLKDICKVFSKETGQKTKEFSYKNKGSQCTNCKGSGVVATSLDVAAKSMERCESCKGNRYSKEVLTYKVNNINVAQVLSFTIHQLKEWLESYKTTHKVIVKLNELASIGLGHLRLDQSVKSLSAGEKQRLLLMQWLEKSEERELLILDEPSIGLHFSDIDLLYKILKELSKKNDVLVIDHNPYLLGQSDVGVKMS